MSEISYIVVDTETSGLFDYSKRADEQGQPRLAALALIFCDAALYPLSSRYRLVRPDGWEMNPSAEAVHKLTTEYLLKNGIPLADALLPYAEAIDAGACVIAYNASFDTKVLRGELRRLGQDDRYASTKTICTMIEMKKHCAKKRGFPKLAEAYMQAFGQVPADQHRANGDAAACLSLARYLKERGYLPEPNNQKEKAMSDNTVTRLVPGSKPDAEVAKELKARIIETLQPALKVMDEAKEHGFTISFNIGPDFLGRNHITVLQLSKLF